MSQSPKYPKIVVTPPGPKAREIVKEDQSLISRSLVRFYPLVAESGKGCIVKDVDGNEFIDFNSGLVCRRWTCTPKSSVRHQGPSGQVHTLLLHRFLLRKDRPDFTRTHKDHAREFSEEGLPQQQWNRG